MSDDTKPTLDPETAAESLAEARAAIEDALDRVAEAAYHFGEPRDLLPREDSGDISFDHDDLRATGEPLLVAIATIADAIYQALDLLPEDEDEDEDDGEDEDS